MASEELRELLSYLNDILKPRRIPGHPPAMLPVATRMLVNDIRHTAMTEENYQHRIDSNQRLLSSLEDKLTHTSNTSTIARLEARIEKVNATIDRLEDAATRTGAVKAAQLTRLDAALEDFNQHHPLDGYPPVFSERAVDGSGNNDAHADWGAAGTTLLRLGQADYGDGISSPAGADRASPREISNAVVQQDGDMPNSHGVSNFIWTWGQFLDHDIDLTPSATTEVLGIAIPAGDPYFDPFNTGTAQMPFGRSGYVAGTGTDVDNPREHPNVITAFIDGSNIYGSSQAVLDSVRDAGGKLKIDANGLLFETGGGSLLTGDVRAGENVALTSMHTLFVLEHNRQVDLLRAEHPELTDDQLFLAARTKVEAIMQAITFNEFLPKILGPDAIADYSGYHPDVNPGIATEFSTAAYRLGHSLLSASIERLEENGDDISGGGLALRDAFFNPSVIAANGGIEPILRGLADGAAQELDVHIVEDVRSFLFGPPGAGGLDLAALNIERGRDHGLPDYNDMREAMGLDRAESFADITSDHDLQTALASVYDSVDDVDLWVGGLAEDPLDQGMLGELFSAILVDQFTRLRDGDSQWSQNVLEGSELDDLWSTTLSDVILRNTGIDFLQHDAFLAYDRIGGTNGADHLVGGDGRDLLIGHAGKDVLDGGKGDDELFGGGGMDYFIFGPEFGNDVIRDYHQGEKLDFTSIADVTHLGDIAIDYDTGSHNVVLTVAGHGSVTLENVELTNSWYAHILIA